LTFYLPVCPPPVAPACADPVAVLNALGLTLRVEALPEEPVLYPL